VNCSLALVLLLQISLVEEAQMEADLNRINPNEARVLAAAKSPESLWAFIIDPSTRYDDRKRAAEMASEILPPRYMAILTAARLELEQQNGHHWWVYPEPRNVFTNEPVRELPERVEKTRVLGFEWQPPPEPMDNPTTLAELRRTPWPWQVERALESVEIATGDAPGIDIAQGLRCASPLEERVMMQTIQQFPMTAETYGVVRNLLAPRPAPHIGRMLPSAWSYRSGDDWYAAQAFIAALAPQNDPPIMIITEPIGSISRTLFSLEQMIQKMRDSPDEPFPYTAFLALAKRIDEEPLAEGNECGAAYDAARLVQVLDHPPVEETPPFGTVDGCRTWLREFHEWLQIHRAELESGAAAEFTAIADARSRMNQVSLCRP
jgi:hypothetical protein